MCGKLTIVLFLLIAAFEKQARAQDFAVKGRDMNQTNIHLFCHFKPDGLYEHPQTCTRYIQCLGNVTTELSCEQCFEVEPVQAVDLDLGRAVKRTRNVYKIKPKPGTNYMKKYWDTVYKFNSKPTRVTSPKTTQKPRFRMTPLSKPGIQFVRATTSLPKTKGRSIRFYTGIPAFQSQNLTKVTNATAQLNSMEEEDFNDMQETSVGANCMQERMVFSSWAGRCVSDPGLLCVADGHGARITPPSSQPEMTTNFCGNGKANVTMRYPGDCVKYLECRENLTLERHCPFCLQDPATCPQGTLHFDEESGQCVLPVNSTCRPEEDRIATPVNIEVPVGDEEQLESLLLCRERADGNYFHPLSCHDYLSCSGEHARIMACPTCDQNKATCPEGRLLYNEVADACLPAGDLINCTFDTSPPA